MFKTAKRGTTIQIKESETLDFPVKIVGIFINHQITIILTKHVTENVGQSVRYLNGI